MWRKLHYECLLSLSVYFASPQKIGAGKMDNSEIDNEQTFW